MNFEFATAGRIVFGKGSLSALKDGARLLGSRALVVTGRNPARAGGALELLRAGGVEATTFPIAGEPAIQDATRGAAAARKQGAEVIVGFGGGSAIDAAKAIAALATNEGDALDYLEVIGKGRPLATSPLPCIAIPTTAGTGAEVTRNAVLSSPGHGVKVSLRHALMLPRVAIVDPELTLGLPPEITAATGMDALTQLIEPYLCLRANPMTDGLCIGGMKRAARSLQRAFDSGDDSSAREDMAMASLFGGLALANAGLGAVHGFAAPIGGQFKAPHGAVCAALLPHAMALNLKALREHDPGSPVLARFVEIARILTGRPEAFAEDGIECISMLAAHLRIPGLREHGIDEVHIPELITKGRQASSMKANPIALSEDELGEILRRAL